jgi:Na+/H+-dicarboxylate symporter
MRRFLSLPVLIVAAIVAGLAAGITASATGLHQVVIDWVKPLGTIFIALLKLVAIPLVVTQLVLGVASARDLRSLSRLGGRTLALYAGTTLVAITVGLLLAHLVAPGRALSAADREDLRGQFAAEVGTRTDQARAVRDRGPLQPLVDLVPDNVVRALSDNQSMLQVVFFALLFGVALLCVPTDRARPVLDLFEGLNAVFIGMVKLILYFAVPGVFALMTACVAEFARDDPSRALGLLGALGLYFLTVVAGLVTLLAAVYPLILRFVARVRVRDFWRAMIPAQLVAFSTSSSSATLPVTLRCVEDDLGVPPRVAGFVLPVGATVNMDGTSLYQAVATVFIAQAFGVELTFGAQLAILFTALLASVGAAGVPGTGLVTLVIVLEAVGIDPGGLALILAVDRLLDMFRSVVNVTGDAMVCLVVAAWEKARAPE